MSNSSNQSKPAATSTKSKKSKLSSILLFVVLALLIAALAYDYGVARPAVEEAYAMIDEKSVEFDNDPDRVLTRGTIGDLLGRPADETTENGTSTVDVYRWTSGLLFKTHNLYVSYKRTGGADIFFRLEKFGFEPEVPSGDAPDEQRGTAAISNRLPDNLPADDESEEKREIPPFESVDRNSDGKLNAAEMPEVEEADADGDGTVSKAEYEDYMRWTPEVEGN